MNNIYNILFSPTIISSPINSIKNTLFSKNDSLYGIKFIDCFGIKLKDYSDSIYFSKRLKKELNYNSNYIGSIINKNNSCNNVFKKLEDRSNIISSLAFTSGKIEEKDGKILFNTINSTINSVNTNESGIKKSEFMSLSKNSLNCYNKDITRKDLNEINKNEVFFAVKDLCWSGRLQNLVNQVKLKYSSR